MIIENFTEEAVTPTSSVIKVETNEIQNKQYKNYGNNKSSSICNNNSQQQKTRNFPSMKYTNGNNNNKHFNTNLNKFQNNNNMNFDANSSNYNNMMEKYLRSQNFENTICSNNTSNRNVNLSPNSPQFNNNTQNNNNFKTSITSTNPTFRYKTNHGNHKQQYHYYNNNNSNYNYSNSKNQQVKLSSNDFNSGPVPTAVFTSTWRSRNSNSTSTLTTSTGYNIKANDNINKSNSDDNNNENIIISNKETATAVIATSRASLVTLANLSNLHYSTVLLNDTKESNQPQSAVTNSDNSSSEVLLKVSSNTNTTTKNQSSNQANAFVVVPTTIIKLHTEQQIQQNRQTNLNETHSKQSSENDCPTLNSCVNPAKIQTTTTTTTTAKTKSSPHSTSSSSSTSTSTSSSSPLPPFSGTTAISSGNQVNNQENGGGAKGVGGGGGKNHHHHHHNHHHHHHSNRKKYWKVGNTGGSNTSTLANSTAGSTTGGCTSAISGSGSAGSGVGSSTSVSSLSNGIAAGAAATANGVDANVVDKNNNNNSNKNNNNSNNNNNNSSKKNYYRNHRGQRYLQQHPELWKKSATTSSMSSTSETSVTASTATPSLSVSNSNLNSTSSNSVSTTAIQTINPPAKAITTATSALTATTTSTAIAENNIAKITTNAISTSTVTTLTTTDVQVKTHTESTATVKPVSATILNATDKTEEVKKSTSDASTTTTKTEKLLIAAEDRTTPVKVVATKNPPQQQQPLLPILKTTPIPSDNCSAESAGINENNPILSPGGSPSYSLDFLHSVGKRMAVNGTYPGAKSNGAPMPASIAPSMGGGVAQRSSRYGSHSNNHHHHHHHPQPQQLTIASFLQKDIFGSVNAVAGGGSSSGAGTVAANVAGGIRAVSGGGVGGNSGSGNSADSAPPHAFNSQAQHQHQQRFQNYYNRPQTAHFYRQQAAFFAGMPAAALPSGSASRYHNSNEHNQHRNRNAQRQQQQYGSNGSGSGTTNHNKSSSQQATKSINNQNGSSPSSSNSSLSSLTSAASSHKGGGGNSTRQSTSNAHKSRANPSMEMTQTKNGTYLTAGNGNSSSYRHGHGNQNRHHGGGHHFGHYNHLTGHNGVFSTGVPPPIMMHHQNLNNLTYVPTSASGHNGVQIMNLPHHLLQTPTATALGNGVTINASSSRACSPSFQNINTENSSNMETTQAMLMNIQGRFMAVDQHQQQQQQQQQAFMLANPHLLPTPNCPPLMNIKTHETASNNITIRTGTDCDDSDCSSSLHSENNLQRSSSCHQLRPGSSMSNSSSQVPSPIDFGFNPLLQQLQHPTPIHYPSPPYRNGMLPPPPTVTTNQLSLNAFYEDDIHLHGALQQQLANMFFTPAEQLNGNASVNTNNNPFPPNTISNENLLFNTSLAMNSNSAASSPRSNEDASQQDAQQLSSARSSPTTSEQTLNSSAGSESIKGSLSDISEIMHEQQNEQGNGSTSNRSNSLPSSRGSRINRNHHHHQQHQQQYPQMPPPFMQFPVSQQTIFCCNYLAYLRSTPSSSSSDLTANTPPERFMTRSLLMEVRETPNALLNGTKWDHLSQQIWNKFIFAQQTEDTYKSKLRLWRNLYYTIKQTYPRYGLYLVGSTMSGFGADNSDVDMCLVSRSFAFVEQRMEALFNLTILRECLKKSEEFQSLNLIEAKVPILRFRDKCNHFEVDLNFNNSVGIKNTHLLYCYTQLDWRLRPLALIVKLWAQYHDINNAKNMTVSSYSLVLMVIHFLQCGVSPPVLPCLHKMYPEKFTPLRSNDFGHVDMSDNVGLFESQNKQALGELFLNFLEYYSSFDYRQNAISVRTGSLLPVNVCRQAKSLKNDVHQWKELCIEEPFDLTNTARSVYDYDTFERVKSVFYTSHHVLLKSLDINSVFAPLALPRTPISARAYTKRRNTNANSPPLITPKALSPPAPATIAAADELNNNIKQHTQVQTLLPSLPPINEKLTNNCDNQALKESIPTITIATDPEITKGVQTQADNKTTVDVISKATST